MEEHPPPPSGQPAVGPPRRGPTSNGSGHGRFRLHDRLSIVLIALIVINVLAAGLLASELYARHRAEGVVAGAIECVILDKANVSFGATPFLLQLATSHYRHLVIHTAGNRIANARGMEVDMRIDDVRLGGDADAAGTIGTLDATIAWSADGMKQTIQESIPVLRGFVTMVTTNPHDGTIRLQGNLGSLTIKPQVTDGQVGLRVADVSGVGLLVPREMAQSALDAFTTHHAQAFLVGIRADSLQVTAAGVTAHFSTRDRSILPSNQGDRASTVHQEPCLTNL